MNRHSSLYFSDGEKTIDFVLVYKSALLGETRLPQFETFIENLLKTNLNIEVSPFTVNSSITFVKIHASDDVITRFADVYSIDLACRSIYYRPPVPPPPNFMATPLTVPNEDSDVYQRAPESVSSRLPSTITSTERIMILYRMLCRMKYGHSRDQYGITKLLKEKVFVDAYPLHEGPYEWTEFGKLTDRQLLAKFWGNIHCWYKEQPINLVEKYFGTQFGFYFAWLGYYVKMLMPMAVLSVLCVLYGVVTIRTTQNTRRPEYIEHATETKFSSITEKNEPHINETVILVGYTITLISLLFMLFLVMLAAFGVMIYRISVEMILIRDSKDEIIVENTRVIASVTGACLNAMFILIFREMFKVVALKLTNRENHRTQNDYDTSYIFKRYSLEFINNYAVLFYIAFFRGRFFTHPGDIGKWTYLGGLGSDTCAPTGCTMDLGISLMIIMMSKIVVSNFSQIVLPIIITKFQKIMANIKHSEDLPLLYEKEYFMQATEQYFLVDEYLDMVIQYGFVVFFAAGFPLAPLLAFLNNLLEVRVDAIKLTRSYRRPIPRKTSSLGAWFVILQATTYIGVAINALVIAFTSSFVQNEIFRLSTDEAVEGFLNTTISAFSTNDFEILARSLENPTVCFYVGRRYPPDHENKYELTKDYWFLLAARFVIVLCFEHVLIVIKGILAYAIPDVPGYVTVQLALQERRNKDLRMKPLTEKYMEERKKMGFKTAFNSIELS